MTTPTKYGDISPLTAAKAMSKMLKTAQPSLLMGKFSQSKPFKFPVPDIVVEDPLYICAAECDECHPQVTASDPLAQRGCHAAAPHLEDEYPSFALMVGCDEYDPQILDSMIGEAVEAEAEKHRITFRRYEGLTDEQKKTFQKEYECKPLVSHVQDSLVYGISAIHTKASGKGGWSDEGQEEEVQP